MFFCLSISVLQVLTFLATNWDWILTLSGFILYAIRATKWGQANAKALTTLTAVIENLNHKEIKDKIREKSADLPQSVVDAISDAVRTVDPKQDTPTVSEIVKREALRVVPGAN